MSRSEVRIWERGCLVLLLLLGLIPLFVAWLTWSEHSRRAGVLAHGTQAVGEVIRAESEQYGRLGGCEVEFAYDVDGFYTVGSAFSCRLMERHPQGSRVPVRYDPEDPDGALIVGDSTWPIYWSAPLILTAIWLALAWALAWPVKPER